MLNFAMPSGWTSFFTEELSKSYWEQLSIFIESERTSYEIYPPPNEVFAAFFATALQNVKVVIVGQDPYHQPGQAHGLSFSVNSNVAIPPSLRNIFTELQSDVNVDRFQHPAKGNLTSWAEQGVLLLNTTCTVRRGEAGSHSGKGWEKFTTAALRAVAETHDHVVFILWGKHAQSLKAHLESNGHHHTFIESPHPSPLSAYRGFFGSKPFSKADTALTSATQDPIDWSA
jgi:uracil-DNA glycosylase